ncbi:MAG: response regulator [Phycisphaerales bacterium]|nr:response regulator [Phycisphaerales bacterium]
MALIVVAEDQSHIRHVLAMWMRKHGYEVLEASTGRAAYEQLTRVAADLLVTDVNMPEMDGIELAGKALASCPTLRGVVVVTSRCDQSDIVEQLRDPRVFVYPKPFSPSQLLREVEGILGQTAAAGTPNATEGGALS